MKKDKGGKKRVSFGNVSPVAEKKARFSDPTPYQDAPISWRFSSCDKNGPFSWAALADPKYKCIVEKLHEYETKNFNDLHKAGSHPIETGRLAKAARDRLKDIKLDDIEALMSFRCEGDDRVWCIPEGALMRVLWYDPGHMVYPVAKDRADRLKHSGQKD